MFPSAILGAVVCAFTGAWTPHFFEVVEFAHFRPKDMHNDIASINQHPVAGRHALNNAAPIPLIFDVTDQVIRKGRDMSLRAATCDDHVIGDGCFAF